MLSWRGTEDDVDRPWKERLVGKFAGIANNLRGLHDSFGTAGYTVWLVWISWSGKRKGEGTPMVARELQITPTPRTASANAIRYRYQPAGITREGALVLDRIGLPDARGGGYPFDQLRGLEGYGKQMPANVEFIWELRPVDDGGITRFSLAGEPWHDAGRLQWVVSLMLMQANAGESRTATTGVY